MKKSVLLLVFAMCSSVFAQPNILWSRTYGGSEEDVCYSGFQTEDGGFIFAGYYSHGSIMDPKDFYVVKTNSDGDMEWEQTFGDTRSRKCMAMHPVENGGYILVGTSSYWLDPDNSDIWLLRIDSNGDSLWSRQYGAAGAWEEAFDVKSTPDGGFILGGYAAWNSSFLLNFWAIKTDSQGNIEWQSTYGPTGSNNVCNDIEILDDGYILAGHATCTGDNCYNFLVIKVDLNGDSLWAQQYEGGSCQSMYKTADGGFLLAGHGENPGEDYDARLIRIDSEGNAIWSHSYGGANNDYVQDVTQTPDGGFVFVGWSFSFGPLFSDAWIFKVDANGDSLWSTTIGSVGGDVLHSIQQLDDGSLLLAGRTNSFGAGGYDFYLTRTIPPLYAEPERLDFAERLVPFEYVLPIIIHNTTNETISLIDATANLEAFSVINFEQGDLLPGDSVEFSVSFSPTGSFLYEDTLIISTQPTFYEMTIPLSGTGVEFQVSCNPETPVLSGFVGDSISIDITLANNGGYGAVIDTVYFDSNDDVFSISPLSVNLSVGGQAQFEIVFHPANEGTYESELCFIHNVPPDSEFCITIHGEATISGTDELTHGLPNRYYLESVYPNPFNPSTTISFGLPQQSTVTISVFDITGRLVETIVENTLSAGVHSVQFDGTSLSSGLYFCTMQAGSFTSSRKMILLK